MKTFVYFFLLAAAAIYSDPTAELILEKAEIQPMVLLTPETIPKIQENQKGSFVYMGLGATGMVFPFIPDFALGRRTFGSHHAWDINAGIAAWPGEFHVLYGQTSYLYFLKPIEGPYVGAGLTIGLTRGSIFPFGYTKTTSPYFNIPITVGYQFEGQNDHTFVQMQVTPLATITINYGFGF